MKIYIFANYLSAPIHSLEYKLYIQTWNSLISIWPPFVCILSLPSYHHAPCFSFKKKKSEKRRCKNITRYLLHFYILIYNHIICFLWTVTETVDVLSYLPSISSSTELPWTLLKHFPMLLIFYRTFCWIVTNATLA